MCFQVYVAIEYWKDLPTAADTVRGPAIQPPAAAAQPRAGSSAAAAAAAAADDSDDELVPVETLSLDQVIEVTTLPSSCRQTFKQACAIAVIVPLD